MFNNRLLLAVIIFSLTLSAFNIVGAVWYSPLAWGFNLFHFLPPGFLIVYAALILTVIFFSVNFPFSTLTRFARYFERRPFVVVSLATAVLLSISILLRIRVPLLGDNFIIISNFENTFNGTHAIHIFREPLALWSFYGLCRFFGTFAYPAILNAFLAGELLLEIFFIALVFCITRLLELRPPERLLLFLAVISGAYMEVFFGYVEIYAVVVVAVAFFILIGLLHLKGTIPLAAVFGAFFLAVASHLLAIILLPAVLYLGIVEYRRTGWKQIAIALSACAGVAAFLVFGFRADIVNIFPSDAESHLLALAQHGDQYQAWPLFSIAHVREILNLCLLCCPMLFLLVPLIFVPQGSARAVTRQGLFLVLCVAGYGAFILVAKFDLGMATDWDVNAAWFMCITLGLGYTYLRRESEDAVRGFAMLSLACFVTTMFWFHLNATVQPNIDRKKSFLDSRMLAEGGMYLNTYHLDGYYSALNNAKAEETLWQTFVDRYPDNSNGYWNLLGALHSLNDTDRVRIRRLYDSWMSVASSDRSVRLACAGYLWKIAEEDLDSKNYAGAEEELRASLGRDSSNSGVWYDLGRVNIINNRMDLAAGFLEKAIALDSTFVPAFAALGGIRLNSNAPGTAIPLYYKAVTLDSTKGEFHWYLGIAYQSIGDQAEAIDQYKLAARLGYEESRSYLNSVGVQW